MRTRRDESARRRVELARIHIQAQQLGLDEEVRRSMMHRLTGKWSSAEMDATDRAKVLDHLRRQLGQRAHPQPRGTAPHNLHAADAPRELGKIAAILAEAGRGWEYADGVARRVAKVERCAFLDAAGARKVCAALTIDQRRRKDRAAKEAADEV